MRKLLAKDLGLKMFDKIENEIYDFTKTIKEEKGCDEMLSYVNSNFFASVKVLMFASSTFSVSARMLLFLLIALTGILMSASIGAIALSSSLLTATTVFIFAIILIFVTHCKKILMAGISEAKRNMKESQKKK